MRPLCAAALLLWTACEPADLSGSLRAYVYRLDAATRDYALVVADVDHLTSLRAVDGQYLSLRSGGELNFTLDAEGVRFEVRRGEPFALEYTVDAEGVVVPGDLHSFYGLSLYRNLDRAATLLAAHGFEPSAKLDVFYFPRMDNFLQGDTRTSLTDNAAYAFEANGFLIVPSLVLAELPMFLNEGVMAHEYGHAVVDQVLFPSGGSPSGDRHLSSTHEGVADLIGFVASADSDYIRATANVDRDLAVPADYTPADFAQLTASGEGSEELLSAFDPHHHGSVMARAVYELWPKQPDGAISEADRLRLLDLTLAALRAIEYRPYPGGVWPPELAGEFTLATFPDTLVSLLPAGDQAAACAILQARLAPLAAALRSCP